ncbi:MAG: hypothetical protein J6336_00335 [Kiritimatiellae bacterium]|nr:hypothetical protein [Kiritimatiellia bacterium]
MTKKKRVLLLLAVSSLPILLLFVLCLLDLFFGEDTGGGGMALIFPSLIPLLSGGILLLMPLAAGHCIISLIDCLRGLAFYTAERPHFLSGALLGYLLFFLVGGIFIRSEKTSRQRWAFAIYLILMIAALCGTPFLMMILD